MHTQEQALMLLYSSLHKIHFTWWLWYYKHTGICHASTAQHRFNIGYYDVPQSHQTISCALSRLHFLNIMTESV